jgi:hypothetical protein
MGQWGDDPLENDNALDEVYAHLRRLCNRVRRLACKPHRPGDSLATDSYQMAAAAELVMLIARRVYRAAAFTAPIRGAPLPDPEAIARWRERFLARWGKHARRQFEGSAAEVAAMGQDAVKPLDQLRQLAEEQGAQLEATFRAAHEEVAARLRAEARPRGKRGRAEPGAAAGGGGR